MLVISMPLAEQHNFRIAHLVDTPAALSTLIRWFIDEWEPWYGPDGGGDAESDLADCSSRDALPICLVALGAEAEVFGSVALRTESVGDDLGVGPWLAGFLVGRAYRGQGVGRGLAEAIKGEARRLGFESIFTSVEPAVGARLARRGWEPFGSAESLRSEVTVYRRQLA